MEIRVEAHGPHVAVVTIDNQPRRNAMTRQMMAELAAQWDALERASYRCIVLTGAGDRAFSSGADLAGDLSADPALAAVVNHALLKHHPYTKPIVAAVNGDCAGAASSYCSRRTSARRRPTRDSGCPRCAGRSIPSAAPPSSSSSRSATSTRWSSC
jgi:enoyl-CoA hydratase/carnithine racemase